MKISQKVRRFVVFRLATFLYSLFNVLPHKAALFVGGWAGLLAWKIISKDQRLMFRHLSLCYDGLMSPNQKVRLGQKVFINSGRNLVDVVRVSRHYESDLKSIIEIDRLEHFDCAYRRGNGVIGVTGHIGNFELLAVVLSKLGYKIGVISRPLADKNLNNLLVKNREKAGVKNFYASDLPLGMVKWLKSGGAVGVLIDTDSSRVKGEFVPAFGRMAKVPVGQSIMALELSIPLIPMACIRNEQNAYRVIIRPEIPINRTGDHQRDIYNITLNCSREIDKIINEFPEQWIWMHNRWRSTPAKNET